MRKRILCMFLAGVMVFTGTDFTVVAVEDNYIEETEPNIAENEESPETENEDRQDSENTDEQENGSQIAEEPSEGTTAEEPEKTDDQEQSENQEEKESEENNADQESVSPGEGEQQEDDSENSSGNEGTEEEDETEGETSLIESEEEPEENHLSDDETGQGEKNVQADSAASEVYATRSSDAVNSAVKDYIYSFQNIYPEGSVWSSSYDGGKQCFGFAMLIADKVFGCHPRNTSIRKASNGAVSNGWTCYYVNAGNCNSLTVEPGDLIDSPTKATSSHTAMVVSVSGSSITCVQCNLSGNCKVYWKQNFNYNSKNASLAQIYSRFGGYGTIRLWKPGEALKNAVVGSAVADTEAPRVGAVTVSNNNDGTGVIIGAMLDFSCNATDNVGVTKAWAVVTGQSASKRFEATVSGNRISGTWSTRDFVLDETISMTVYAQDAAGNTGSSSLSIALGEKVGVTPDDIVLEVGEKATVNAWINDLYKYDPTQQYFGFWYGDKEAVSLSYEGLCAEVIGVHPGACIIDFTYNISSDTSAVVGCETAHVHVIPNTPTLTSITNAGYKQDYIEYMPVDYAEAYDLYRLREGADTDYQFVGTFKKNETNSITIEHPADGSTYYYKITAKAAQVTDETKNPEELYYPTSRFSNSLTSTTTSFTPTNLTAVSSRDNEIDLTWDAVADASGYEIYRYTEESGKELLAVQNAAQTGYTDTDVDGGVTYYYDVYAVDVVGEKGMEATASCNAKGFREEKIFYTVSFYSGFDSILIADEKVQKGQFSRAIVSSGEQMQMDGYEFVGWYTKPDGAGECYTSETQIMSDTVLYAFWKEKEEEKSGKFWVVPVGDQKYTGKAIKPAVKVYDGNTLLVQGTDYTVSYKNNVKVCDAGSVEISKAPSVIVKGRKNYSGRETILFSIVAVDLNESGITAEDMIAAYTGRELKPVPVLYHNGKKMKYKTDYTVIYPQSLRTVGQYNIEVTGKGGYTGRRTISYTITDKLLLNKANVSKIPNQIYSGKLLRPALTVKYGNIPLREDIAQDGNGDYTVRYINNRNIGIATVILTAVEGSAYTGSKTVHFKITGTPISKVSVAAIGNYTYSGEAIRPQVNLTFRAKSGEDQAQSAQLREGIDYTLSYSNNINAGIAKILITGKGKYTGRRTVTFKITPYDLSKLPAKSRSESEQVGYYILVNDGHPVAYQKGKTQPAVTVSYSDYSTAGEEPLLKTYVLAENDYKVTYKNVNSVSAWKQYKPQILISGKGNYKGTITSESAKFEIVKADLSAVSARATDISYRPKEGGFTATKVSLYDTNGKKLAAGTDYDRNFIYYNVTDYMVADYGMNLQTAASCEFKVRDRADFESELEKADNGTSQKILKLNKKIDIPSVYQIVCVKINAMNTNKCNYTGAAYAFYRIGTSNIEKCSVKVKSTFAYTGDEQKVGREDLAVTTGSGKNWRELIYGRDYLIDEESYANNIEAGTAKVNIYGIGSYYGMKRVSFKIKAKKFLYN